MAFVTSSRRMLGLLLVLGLSALLIISFACGGNDSGGDGGGATTPADGGNGAGEEQTFDVRMGDNFFEPNKLTVPAGATVTINLTNGGKAIHNMRVSGEDGKFNTDDDAVSDPDLFKAGDTGTVVWTAPDEPGEIDFQCDFHTTDMTGKITVK